MRAEEASVLTNRAFARHLVVYMKRALMPEVRDIQHASAGAASIRTRSRRRGLTSSRAHHRRHRQQHQRHRLKDKGANSNEFLESEEGVFGGDGGGGGGGGGGGEMLSFALALRVPFRSRQQARRRT